MAKKTGPSNPNLKGLIQELKKRSIEQKVNIWKRVALDLERSTRQRRIVNLSRLNKHTNKDEIIVIPGKVLGAGVLEHPLTISAFQYSSGAKEKLLKIGAKIVGLEELSKESPKGKKIRIIG